MLLLTRRINEALNIGPDIRVTVTRIRGRQVTLGIEAPRDLDIWREELEGSEKLEDIEELDARARRYGQP